jgi:hypothetical protein
VTANDSDPSRSGKPERFPTGTEDGAARRQQSG